MIKKELKLNNGETLFYFEQGNVDAKKTLLLVHGNTSAALFFKPLFELLAKEDVRVLAPDLRGFGDSSYNQNINTLNDFSNDLKLMLDELAISKVELLGWSLGGSISMDFASTYPEIVNSLVLLSSGSPKGYPIFRKNELAQPILGDVYQNKEEMGKDPVQVLPLLNIYSTQSVEMMTYIYDQVIYTSGKPDVVENQAWMKEALKQRNLVDVDWALATFNISNEVGFYGIGNGAIDKLIQPILIIWGDKDLTVPKFMFDETVRLLPNAEVVVYANAGHSIMVDNPNQLANDLLNFIK